MQLKPWGSPPQEQRLPGRRPVRRRRQARLSARPGRHRALSQPDLRRRLPTTATTPTTIMQVDPLLGGNDALRELLDEAHARDMRVVLDGVFNHAGRGFWAFHHILENGRDSPYIDWFIINDWPLRAYARTNAEPPNYTAWWNLPALPKFNTDNPGVRDYLFGRGPPLDRFRHRRLAAGRARRHRRRRLLAANSARTVKERQPRRLYLRRNLDTTPSAGCKGTVRRGDELHQFTVPALSLHGGSTPAPAITQQNEYDLRPFLCPPIRPGDRHHARPATTGDQPGPAQPARQPRHCRARCGSWATTRAPCAWPCCCR